MGAWAIASLFIISSVWMENEAEPQIFQNYQRPLRQYYQPQIIRIPRQQRFGYFFYPQRQMVGVATQLHSASGLQPQKKLTSVNLDPLARKAGYDLGSSYQPNSNFDNNFQESLNLYKFQERQPQIFPIQEASERHGDEERHLDAPSNYDDHRTSRATHILGPHQVETIKTEHYHKKVPAFDVSDFQHKSHEKHGEVHYHQHKHIHKHDHKQEHLHQHKNEHQHKHLHNQDHKHDHHSEHKHGHQHKHEHNQDHKHDHNHDHKHDHHQDHKHNHHHGHKHQHHSESKHEHKHGHKHEHEHESEHKHKHQHSKQHY